MLTFIIKSQSILFPYEKLIPKMYLGHRGNALLTPTEQT